MNWHLRIVSVLVLLFFATVSAYYYRYYISPQRHGVILFIAPGLTPELIAHYETEYPDRPLFITSKNSNCVFVNNSALKNPDASSIMSYFASGYPGANNQLGLDRDHARLDNLLYRAQRNGRLVGIISTTSIISPIIASFYSHTDNAADREELARQLFDSTTIQVILGAGSMELQQSVSGKKRNLLNEARLSGYEILRTNGELEDVPVWTWKTPWKTRKLLGLFADYELPYYNPLAEDRSPEEAPTLKTMTSKAIECLQFNLNGYLLIVYQGKIERACEDDNYLQILSELRQLDLAMQEAHAYAGDNAMILLYSPYESQGPSVHTPGTPPPGSSAILPARKWNKALKKYEDVTLAYPGPFRPGFEFKKLNGWAAFYSTTPGTLNGFITPSQLNEYLSGEL